MLYNPESASNLAVPWFEPRYWIARGAVVGEALGRGTTLIVKEGARRLVLRHYRRGGLAARISPDRYLWRGESVTRPFHELALIARLHAAGLPVPVPVAARYQREGATYCGDIITEYLSDTQSLAQRLAAGPPGFDTWAAIGRCLRRFHDAGVCHADLNAHNILLRDATTVFLIDFDRGSQRLRDGLWRDANLVRLRRSLEKLNDQHGDQRFDDLQWHCLLSAYH
ncbi:MAG TPA: 3-deoxy-D-manno-octulosonic acid kinase [Steroidobacteraceae bacterium]|jgi:3-deoxy-D-manno-octulosonic acid kinase|nr:3-deoxy-D-manno-octulosonic acid kinase [Steroidobacteraceae bacterium]